MPTEQTWKVGPLAEACGLTVRTLHHWDRIGLLSPSRRTASGHRAYTEQDVVRLYQVLALRRLGLGLETIATCLDAGIDPVRLVGEHLAATEASLTALQALHERLAHLHGELTASRTPDTADLLRLVRATGATGSTGPAAQEALRRHLDDDQLHALADHAAALGPAAHYLLEVEWPQLYRRAEALRTAGTAPTDPRVRRIAERLDELARLFSGGDTTLSSAVRTAWREDPAAMSGDPHAPADAWAALRTFLDRARQAS
ncbi:MerR family transcriptional regulator [Streptomyces sp. 1331.2]|uniref:MerR family transcriptional regulator n=1 Tax=Streptomyces sp. 1331.2 TaxID=1938835 RepID=UPI000BDA0D1C|nr:MerR family transcriptional regulator [Streptomyces sp. 1331.2]SOB78801.1 DNA-binding transcriptional regulator, MerR family [Streptomyces sp. 1331.2]SOB86343.1 DNA-binding transcriptional regulator, MerR family [Streptomyces sp. 1331.2]